MPLVNPHSCIPTSTFDTLPFSYIESSTCSPYVSLKRQSTRNKFNTNYPKKKHLSLSPSLPWGVHTPGCWWVTTISRLDLGLLSLTSHLQSHQSVLENDSVGWVFLHDEEGPSWSKHTWTQERHEFPDFTLGSFERNIQTYLYIFH